MKKIFRTVAALAVVMFAGCTNDVTNDVVAPVGDGTTVTVGIADTKTYLGELVDGARKVYWHNGDQIAINGVASTAITLNEEKTAAVFEFGAELTHPYSVLYPASMYKDAQTITLPAVQEGATNNFAKDVAPMAAYQATEGTVQMHHLAGVIRLQVKLPAESNHTAHPLNKVETKGNAGEQMSGDFAIDYEAVTLTATSTADADKVVTTKAYKTLDASETDDVFIVVPAREYPQGITVRLIDDAGHYMDIASKAMTIEAGEIKAMPVVEFKPTGTLVGVEIASAEDFIAFANAYNAGEYAEVEPLNVVFTNDIVFDDATNAAWTPIGVPAPAEGGNDNYFGGCVDGQGYSIKNWNSTRPLFAYTDSSAVIENITIDASCTLTANYADESQYYGAFVGYHRGTLVNCHVNAALTASGNWGNAEPHVGALVGRVVVGTVENCTVTGDVTFANTLVTNGKTAYYGGAVARVSNAAGVIKGVSVSGNISHSAGSTYIAEGSKNASDAYVNYGGIVGALAGTCTDCHLTDATKTFFYGNYVYNGGATNILNNHYRTQNVGGIVGQITEGGSVSDCTMYSPMTLNQYNGDIDGTNKDISRYLYAGGIVGYTSGSIKNCTMYAALANRSSCLQQYIGGVVGNVQAKGSVLNCANEGSSMASATTGIGYYQARNNNIGGVIGATYSTNLSNLTNKANLACSRVNPSSSTTITMGGVIGKIEATSGEIDGKGTIVNYGSVYTNHNSVGDYIAYSAVGGVIGEAKCSVKGVVNEGQAYYQINDDTAHDSIYVGGIVGYANNNIAITSVTNNGNVYINGDKGNVANLVHYNLCVGGILGTNNDEKAVTIDSSTNSGTVAFTKLTNKANGRSTAAGGIVGALTNGACSITNCDNTGCVSNANFNNTYDKFVIRTSGGGPHTGGIAGIVYGSAEDVISVTNCTSVKTSGNDSGLLYQPAAANSGNRAVAGLIGTAQYADIKDCECSTYIKNANSSPVAGLVVLLGNSNLEGCTVYNSKIEAGGNGVPYIVGLASLVINSTIKNNTVNNTEFISVGKSETIGVLVGKTDAATTITDNKVSGTIDGTAVTLSSKMVVDGTPTVTGTTLYTE